MKTMIISLMLLMPKGEIQLMRVEIFDTSCHQWFETNVKVTERKKKLFRNLYYHSYKGKKVVGFICNDKEPFQ
tara:strand:- start:194 stop:412 length:219 start_codon:yes stop_codon:yes gene_type:complete